MDDEADDASAVEQLIELLVYAPVGLLYEYQEVLPKLIKRGKSQVQLARVMGQMAANRGQSSPGGAAGDLASLASSVISRLVTEIGSQVGLAPPGRPPSDSTPSASPDVDRAPSPESRAIKGAGGVKRLPIARYDELTAREIIPLLEDLSGEQRQRVRVHEVANRNRKTVLAKLDRLID